MVARLDRRAVSEAIKSCGVPVLAAEMDARASHLRRGWYWGTQAFGEALRKATAVLLKKQGVPGSRAYQKHELVTEHGHRQAEVLLRKGMKAGGLKAADMERVKGSDLRKVLLAYLLWRRTVVSQQWLAEKLAMSSAANVSQQLRRLDRKRALGMVPETMKTFLEEADAPIL